MGQTATPKIPPSSLELLNQSEWPEKTSSSSGESNSAKNWVQFQALKKKKKKYLRAVRKPINSG